MKMLAVILGLFFAAIMYLQNQGILNINWGKLQTTISQPILSTLTNSMNSTGLVGVRQTTTTIPAIIHDNLPFLPVDMGLPLLEVPRWAFFLVLLGDKDNEYSQITACKGQISRLEDIVGYENIKRH